MTADLRYPGWRVFSSSFIFWYNYKLIIQVTKYFLGKANKLHMNHPLNSSWEVWNQGKQSTCSLWHKHGTWQYNLTEWWFIPRQGAQWHAFLLSVWASLVGKATAERLLLSFDFFKIQSPVQFFHNPAARTGTEQGHTSECLLEATTVHEERLPEKGYGNREILEFGSSYILFRLCNTLKNNINKSIFNQEPRFKSPFC